MQPFKVEELLVTLAQAGGPCDPDLASACPSESKCQGQSNCQAQSKCEHNSKCPDDSRCPERSGPCINSNERYRVDALVDFLGHAQLAELKRQLQAALARVGEREKALGNPGV